MKNWIASMIVLLALVYLVMRDRHAARKRQKRTQKLEGSDRDVS